MPVHFNIFLNLRMCVCFSGTNIDRGAANGNNRLVLLRKRANELRKLEHGTVNIRAVP